MNKPRHILVVIDPTATEHPALERANRLARVFSKAIDESDIGTAIDKATASVDELSRRGVEASDELQQTVRDVGEAARALRDFLEVLEREPDMIVKGRARQR